MQTIKRVVPMVAACALSLAALTGSAARPDPADCGTEQPVLCADFFDALNMAISSGGFTNEKDQDGLLCKTDSAVVKVGVQKYDDALVNLSEIDSKVQTLADAAKPKLSREAADNISAAARATADCIINRP